MILNASHSGQRPTHIVGMLLVSLCLAGVAAWGASPTVVGGSGRPILGEDSVQWRPIFKACVEVGGTEWYTIEQEKYLKGKSPMDCVEMSLAGLKQILG